jgi:ATP-dependent helicase/nuclease subunit A
MMPFALYSELLTADGGREAIRGRLGPEADDPLGEFLALALSFPRHGPPTLQHFLHWLGTDEIEVKRELEQGERDEVRLMTVHAAKGLQAPIVFLPDTTFRYQGKKDSLTFTPEGTPLWPAGPKQKRDPVSQAHRNRADTASAREEARLLYVALTRAEDRLYVCGWAPKTGQPPPDCWYNQITAACEELTTAGMAIDTVVDLPDLQGNGFVMGQEPGRGAGEQPPEPEPAPLPAWSQRPAPAEPSPGRPLSPSRPSPAPPAARSPLRDRGAAERRFQRGTLLHRLFQYLPGIVPASREGVATRVLSDTGLSEAEIHDLTASAARVLDDPAFGAIFSPQALVEAPLTGVLGGQVVSGVVDRLLVGDQKVLIVDYKTNRAPPRNPAALPPGYVAQMQGYAGLLAQIYPQHQIEAALLWTALPRLDPVPLTTRAIDLSGRAS